MMNQKSYYIYGEEYVHPPHNQLQLDKSMFDVKIAGFDNRWRKAKQGLTVPARIEIVAPKAFHFF